MQVSIRSLVGLEAGLNRSQLPSEHLQEGSSRTETCNHSKD